MKCKEVRELLPAFVDGDLHTAGEIDAHLARCKACTADLAGYREMLAGLALMRERDFEPGPAFRERILELIPASIGDRARKVKIAVASIGGVAVGATALAIVWWKMAHRGTAAATGRPNSPRIA